MFPKLTKLFLLRGNFSFFQPVALISSRAMYTVYATQSAGQQNLVIFIKKNNSLKFSSPHENLRRT